MNKHLLPSTLLSPLLRVQDCSEPWNANATWVAWNYVLNISAIVEQAIAFLFALYQLVMICLYSRGVRSFVCSFREWFQLTSFLPFPMQSRRFHVVTWVVVDCLLGSVCTNTVSPSQYSNNRERHCFSTVAQSQGLTLTFLSSSSILLRGPRVILWNLPSVALQSLLQLHVSLLAGRRVHAHVILVRLRVNTCQDSF